MAIVGAVKDGIGRYADFSGVSSRSQYWYFVLASYLAIIAATQIVGDGAGNFMYFATLIPTISAAVRRMHNVGKSGWFLLIPIYNFILAITPSKPQAN